jgi:FtsP/CotA-like multicopper oxidase with cupredoxin domain
MALPARAGPPSIQGGLRILEARESSLQILPEPARPTNVWGYNGEVAGPLLRVKKGEELNVRLVNKLSQPTTLHWHGLRIINSMDGAAGLTQEPAQPGSSLDYRFTPPDSGLFWYHPHCLPYSGEQLARGLHGALIIDEETPPLADRDMLAVLTDWQLGEGGQIRDFDFAADGTGAGRIGETVTCNSRAAELQETLPPSARVRLRLFNAAHSRIMVLGFEDVAPLVLAVDSQPCEPFEPAHGRLPLLPGARFDVMFDLAPAAGARAPLMLLGANEVSRPLMSFTTAGPRRPPLPPIAPLTQNPLLPAVIKLEAAHRASLTIEAKADAKPGGSSEPQGSPLHWSLYGQSGRGFGPSPLFSVRRNTPVTLAFVNRTLFPQPMRVHGHAMRILHALDDGWEPYWCDTVLVAPGKTKRVAFIADNPGKWAIESAMAGRQATGLAAWFEVR